MLLHYLAIFRETFFRIPIITTISLIIFLISFSVMFIMIIILLLDRFYRPDIPQYPYNIILDRIMPIILLILPTVFIFVFTRDVKALTLQTRFVLIIIIHLSIIIPIFHYWSNLRSWTIEKLPNGNFITLDNPLLYKQIAIAILYPAIWGLYFTLLRYLRLGIVIDINKYLVYLSKDWIIILIFLLPFYTIWLKMVIWRFLDLRYWLWYELSKLLYAIHIYFLRYKGYFKLFENLYKLAFILGSYVSLNPDVYPQNTTYSKFRYTLKYIYFKPYLLTFFLGFFVVFELFVTKGNIYYSIYILFLYPLVYILIWCLYYLYTMQWVTTVCLADYFVRNWDNPRYPFEFWIFFADPKERYYFDWDYSKEELEEINKQVSRYFNKKYPVNSMLPTRIQNRAWCMRLKGAYRTYTGIHWNNKYIAN